MAVFHVGGGADRHAYAGAGEGPSRSRRRRLGVSEDSATGEETLEESERRAPDRVRGVLLQPSVEGASRGA